MVNGKIEIRPIMVVALTYDHRLLDGREAVTFLGGLILDFRGCVRVADCHGHGSTRQGIHRAAREDAVDAIDGILRHTGISCGLDASLTPVLSPCTVNSRQPRFHRRLMTKRQTNSVDSSKICFSGIVGMGVEACECMLPFSRAKEPAAGKRPDKSSMNDSRPR